MRGWARVGLAAPGRGPDGTPTRCPPGGAGPGDRDAAHGTGVVRGRHRREFSFCSSWARARGLLGVELSALAGTRVSGGVGAEGVARVLRAAVRERRGERDVLPVADAGGGGGLGGDGAGRV